MSGDSTPAELNLLSWEKEVNSSYYHISTAREKLDLDFINDAFSTEDMPWAKRLSEDALQKTLNNSLTLGLYEEMPSGALVSTIDEPSSPRTPSPTLQEPRAGSSSNFKQIGLARLITDHVTFVYLTDVYIAPDYRRLGLARWLMACTNEVIEKHPAIRRAFCITGLAYGAEFYEATLGFHNVAEEGPDLIALTRRYGSSTNSSVLE